jgi:hypothetical protein
MMIIEGIEFWVATPERRRRGSPEREREGGGGFGEKEKGLAFVCLTFLLCVFYFGGNFTVKCK